MLKLLFIHHQDKHLYKLTIKKCYANEEHSYISHGNEAYQSSILLQLNLYVLIDTKEDDPHKSPFGTVGLICFLTIYMGEISVKCGANSGKTQHAWYVNVYITMLVEYCCLCYYIDSIQYNIFKLVVG